MRKRGPGLHATLMVMDLRFLRLMTRQVERFEIT